FWVDAHTGSRSLAARNVGQICRSVRGDSVAFTSDVVVPSENAVYVGKPGEAAHRGGRHTGRLICTWSGRWLVLAGAWSFAPTLFRLDARGGSDRLIARNAQRYSISPDGRTLVYVARRGNRETLVAVDLATMGRTPIAHAAVGRTFGLPALGYAGPG